MEELVFCLVSKRLRRGFSRRFTDGGTDNIQDSLVSGVWKDPGLEEEPK